MKKKIKSIIGISKLYLPHLILKIYLFFTFKKQTIMKKTIGKSKTDIIIKKIVVTTVILVYCLLIAFRINAQGFVGSGYTYINRPLITDEKSNSIQINAKVSFSNDLYSEYGFSKFNVSELGISGVKQFKKFYAQGGFFRYDGQSERETSFTRQGWILSSKTTYTEKLNIQGYGFRLGGGLSIHIKEKNEIAIGVNLNPIFEKQKYTRFENYKIIESKKVIDSAKLVNVGFNIEYRRKLFRGQIGVNTSIDFIKIQKEFVSKLNTTLFLTQGPINIYTNVGLDPKFPKKLTHSVGFSLNLNFKTHKSSGGFLKHKNTTK